MGYFRAAVLLLAATAGWAQTTPVTDGAATVHNMAADAKPGLDVATIKPSTPMMTNIQRQPNVSISPVMSGAAMPVPR